MPVRFGVLWTAMLPTLLVQVVKSPLSKSSEKKVVTKTSPFSQWVMRRLSAG
jgi:hypothetical protein